MCTNQEKIETMTKLESDVLDIKRRIAIIEHNNRELLETNKSLVNNVESLMKINEVKRKESKRNEG